MARREPNWSLRIAVSAVVLMIALMFATLFIPSPARGHDRERPELDSWYRGLHANGGAWCCDGNDATHVAEADWESKGAHYRVRLEGRWIDVPDEAVIDGPNRDGRTLVWPNTGYDGLSIRCFLPGSMT